MSSNNCYMILSTQIGSRGKTTNLKQFHIELKFTWNVLFWCLSCKHKHTINLYLFLYFTSMKYMNQYFGRIIGLCMIIIGNAWMANSLKVIENVWIDFSCSCICAVWKYDIKSIISCYYTTGMWNTRVYKKWLFLVGIWMACELLIYIFQTFLLCGCDK